MKMSYADEIKIPVDPEGRGIFNPTTGNDGRGRASGHYIQLQEIKISSLSLDEKISQMIMARGDKFNEEFIKMGIGGIFIDNLETKEEYKEVIKKFQEESRIKLFAATDMEGYWNPFPFYNSKSFGEINDGKEAFELGKEHGKILNELGFNMDFSPVVEVRNNVWPGRSFIGDKEIVERKIKGYIKGLQKEGILGTAKHYPGGSMVKDPHLFWVKAKVYESDLYFFDAAIDENVSAIMVGHAIVSGAIDSKGKQSSVSKEVIGELRKKFDGLIITDAISMMGLKLSYLFRNEKLYVDLIKAGNDIILASGKGSSVKKVKKGIEAIKKAVNKGEITEERIDESVRRILEKKGYIVEEEEIIKYRENFAKFLKVL